MPDNATLYSTADGMIFESSPDFKYGGYTWVSIASLGSGNRRAFLKFDLSSLPAGAIISLAKLRLNCNSVGSLVAGVSDVEARRVADDSWIEGDLTWNNQKAYGAIEDTTVPAVGWVEWDVASFIQDEYAGDKTVSLCLKCKVESYDGTLRSSNYRSREYGSVAPELYIEYTVEAPPVGGGAQNVAPGAGMRVSGGGAQIITIGFPAE